MAAFDDPELLNEDGTVTLTIVPSNWHVCYVGPDTYSLFTSDYWEEMQVYHFTEETGRDLAWDDFNWTYDHPAIVRKISEALVEWLVTKYQEAGLTSIKDAKVKDSWSPKFYNFVSDGLEMEFTCDPVELRALTEGFNVDEWGLGNYSSYDGFMSWIPGRLRETKWRCIYDGEFRMESLLTAVMDDSWRDHVHDAEFDIYEECIEVELKAEDPDEAEDEEVQS